MCSQKIKVDVLIVGAGPAGASAAVFLGRHGISTMMISRHPSTADSPRAHITNQRAMEALRDAGLEDECMAEASFGENIAHTFWLRSMAGEELARAYSWGNDPARIGDYEAASPCRMSDLPQTKLEPILVRAAKGLGSDVRFNTELLSFTQDDSGVYATLLDRTSGDTFFVRSTYMVGADGARSRVVEQLGIPIIGKHGLGHAINIHCDLDLTNIVAHRKGSLYAIVQPGVSSWAPIAVFRMVQPWNQWLIALMGPRSVEFSEPSREEILVRIRELTGLPDIAINIRSISQWQINDVYAEYYSVGRVFCLGDAVHRHPPTNGLGSNTCIQDAFNLSWKLAMVVRGDASPSLLASYNAERQPVGRQIVARANKSMGQNQKIWERLGRESAEVSQDDSSLDMSARWMSLRKMVDTTKYEYHAHGVEMNRSYSSSAVISDDTEPTYDRDVELFYQPSTHPGAPLPHVWLARRTRGPRVSTLDIVGKCRFVLLTGPGGAPWREAVSTLVQEMNLVLEARSIGPFLDYEDIYGDWNRIANIGEDGCILVRPDLYIAWRSANLVPSPADALRNVMMSILGLTPKVKSSGNQNV